MVRFAKIGVGAGKKFDAAKLSPEMKNAMADGMADACKEFDNFKETKVATGKVTSGDMFGTREFLKNNYLYRLAAAVLGIWGDSKQEAMYPLYQVDADGQNLDASKARYTLRFCTGPASAGRASGLIGNPVGAVFRQDLLTG